MRDRRPDKPPRREPRPGTRPGAPPTKGPKRHAKPGPATAKARAKSRGWQSERAGGDVTILYGWHTVKAAIENPARRFRRLVLTENARRRLDEDGVGLPIEPEAARPDEIDRLLGPDAVHQGFYAEADPLPSPDLATVGGDLVLVLDQVTDPHNVGAIFRTAAAFAVAAIVTTARHSPEATGVLAKSASGALELVPHVVVQNLARAMDELRGAGFQLIGLDSEADAALAAAALRAPVALVIGAEGKGLRQLTRAKCDLLARLDLPGAIKSLNVSNAAALSLYVARQRMQH